MLQRRMTVCFRMKAPSHWPCRRKVAAVAGQCRIGLGPALDLAARKRWRSICVRGRGGTLPAALGRTGPNSVPDQR
jgi:hypothetical protein